MRDFSQPEYAALAEFRFLVRRFLQFSEQAAREAGVEPQQHQLLLAVRAFPEGTRVTVGEIAGRMLLKHHSAVELINRSEQRGLVRRAPDPQDARAVLVELTSEGKALLRRLSVAHHSELQEHGPGLAKALRKLVRNL